MPQTLEDAETDLKINATTLRGILVAFVEKKNRNITSRNILNQFVLFSVCLSHFLFWSRNLVCSIRYSPFYFVICGLCVDLFSIAQVYGILYVLHYLKGG